jgi:xylulokinase
MYLGIDLGTSSVKVVLMNDQQTILASSSQPLVVSRPHSGWSEQHPADWVSATSQALDDLKHRFPQELAAVKGIGLSGHMHGATLLDQSNQVLRPCILWNDTRSHVEAAELDANPLFRALSGNIVFAGFTAPKLVWVKRHEPDIFRQVAKVLLPKDYLRWWLTGEFVSEGSDAAGTAWLEVAKRQWSAELLSACDLTLEQMPRLIEGTEVSGFVRPALAARWGMEKVIVAGGAGDNAASACGMGVVKKGTAFVSLGTSGVLFAATDRYLPNPDSAVHTFCHALPSTWHQMGVILSATDALNWWARIAQQSAAELTQQLGSTLTAPASVLFLPYLAGERTPHNDAEIRGAFLRLAHDTERKVLTQAVLEGVAFALKDNLLALQQAGSTLERMTAVGGGSKSPYWLKVLSTVLNVPIDLPLDNEVGAALGVARLGLIAAQGLEPLEVLTPPVIEQTFEPASALIPAYQHAYERYQQAYPALKTLN